MQYFCVSIDSMPPAVRSTLLRQMDIGSLTCAHILGVCHTHVERGQAQPRLHYCWLRWVEKLSITLLHQGIEPRVLIVFDLRHSIYHWALPQGAKRGETVTVVIDIHPLVKTTLCTFLLILVNLTFGNSYCLFFFKKLWRPFGMFSCAENETKSEFLWWAFSPNCNCFHLYSESLKTAE